MSRWDADGEAIAAMREMAGPQAGDFSCRKSGGNAPLEPGFADVVVSNAVLHFVREDGHF
jgi:hypothetical protein